jgi:hypothetical protein
MCNGQADALPNTHSTITATLIVQSSMPSVVLVAPISTTTSTSTSKSSSLAAITNPRTTAPSTLSIQTATSSSTKTSATVASTTAQAASETASVTPTLTKSQIVGITVASVGGGALAVGTLILFACWRRRKRARDSDMLPFQLDPAYGYGFKGPTEVVKNQRGPGGTSNGIAAKVAPRVPPRIDTGIPNMFSRRSIRPDTIGLALSPERIEVADRRHSSKLLPDKPTLMLKVPQLSTGKVGGALKFSQPIQQPSDMIRQSTATQFEEDYDSADTAVAGQEDWGQGSTNQILNNRAGDWGTIRPVPPDFGNSPQFVVSSSDWRPQDLSSNKAATALAPAFEVKPLKLGRNIGSFSRPLVVGNDPFPKPPPLAQLEIPFQNNRPITQSSSIYSTHNSLPPSDAGRNSNATRRKSYKQSGPHDRQFSTGSQTSFETVESVTSPQDPEPRTAGTDLSPVVESPASGKSPVSYPKIPGRLSRDYIRMVPPPPQPDFGAVFSSQSGKQPWKIAEMNAQRERDRIEAQAQRQNQSQGQALGIGQQGMQGQPYKRQQRDYLAPSAAYNSVPSRNQLPAANPYYPNQTPQYMPARPGPLTQNPSNSRSSSMVSQNSNASSLLAKRRGEQKAQALKLMNEDDKKRQQAKWRVLKERDIERAKSPGWKPQLAGGRGTQFVERNEELPSTPGWLPKLTPTRRGDELFLSVD